MLLFVAPPQLRPSVIKKYPIFDVIPSWSNDIHSSDLIARYLFFCSVRAHIHVAKAEIN